MATPFAAEIDRCGGLRAPRVAADAAEHQDLRGGALNALGLHIRDLTKERRCILLLFDADYVYISYIYRPSLL